jgi:hypothetical protein
LNGSALNAVSIECPKKTAIPPIYANLKGNHAAKGLYFVLNEYSSHSIKPVVSNAVFVVLTTTMGSYKNVGQNGRGFAYSIFFFV